MSSTSRNRSSINPEFSVKNRTIRELDYYLNGLKNGNRYILSECITLIESTQKLKRSLGIKILDALPHVNAPTLRIGITGSPGVGKSTFIESFGLFLIENGHKPSILAIDPSSQNNRGSILGDKTRMEKLALRSEAFIRPTSSGNVLGGTAAFTKDAIQLCEAAGYDFILVETVGVGQSETEVDNITDVNLLLLQPGSGDDIQGIKRGIVENADIFIINKADGPQMELAKQTKMSYKNAIQLFHHEIEGWISPVLLVSSINKQGLNKVYKSIIDYQKNVTESGFFLTKRKSQEVKWFVKQSERLIQQIIFSNKDIKQMYQQLNEDIVNNKINTSAALAKMDFVLHSVLKAK